VLVGMGFLLRLCYSFSSEAGPFRDKSRRLSLLAFSDSSLPGFSNEEGTILEKDLTYSRRKAPGERVSRLKARQLLVGTVEKYLGPMEPIEEWKRAHNYLYRKSSEEKKLSVKQVDLVLNFLSSQLERELVCSIIQSTPRILRKSVSTQLEPTWLFLNDIYPTSMLTEALFRKPDLLLTRGIGYQADELNLIQVYFSQELKMSASQIEKLQKTNGAFLFQMPIHKVLPIATYFYEILLQASPNNEEKAKTALCKLILSRPQLLQLSLEESLKPRIAYLQDRLHLETKEVALFLQSSVAGILGLNLEKNLVPTIDYLERTLLQGSDTRKPTNELKSCIMAHPQILGLSLEQNLKKKVEYFCSLETSDTQLASRILKRAPAVYSLSLTGNIMPTINFLARIWGAKGNLAYDEGVQNSNKSGDSIAALVGEYPSILTLSLDRNIMPTVGFYNKTGFISLDNKWRKHSMGSHGNVEQTVLRGRYIASSLYNCLLPRWHCTVEQDDEQRKNKTDIPLHILAGANDEVFCKHLGLEFDAYQNYKKDAIPKLKFNYQLDSWLNAGSQILL